MDLIQSVELLFGTEENVSCKNRNLQSVFKTAVWSDIFASQQTGLFQGNNIDYLQIR